MNTKPYCVVSGTLFSLVALAHLGRIVFDLPVTVGDYAVPVAVSWIAFVVPTALAAWAIRLASD